MLNSSRALTLNSESGRKLPRVDSLSALYARKVNPRHGEVIMIAGRSGSQKSGFALWYVDELNLPTLYFSADMSAFTASSRVASKRTGLPSDEVERRMKQRGPDSLEVVESLQGSKITFAFGSPIRWRSVNEEIDAYVELWDAYPEVIVLDNLMDFEGAESEYAGQMAVMQDVTNMARETGATVLVLHHATDKSQDANANPFLPPGRKEIKNGMSEKPELTLSVALDPNTMDFRIACLKQRMGPSDPTGRNYVTIKCRPELTRFHAKTL